MPIKLGIVPVTEQSQHLVKIAKQIPMLGMVLKSFDYKRDQVFAEPVRCVRLYKQLAHIQRCLRLLVGIHVPPSSRFSRLQEEQNLRL